MLIIVFEVISRTIELDGLLFDLLEQIVAENKRAVAVISVFFVFEAIILVCKPYKAYRVARKHKFFAFYRAIERAFVLCKVNFVSVLV